MNHNEEARDIMSWLESAVHDMAEGTTWDELESMGDDLYNDPFILRDLFGDRLFDLCNRLQTLEDKVDATKIIQYFILLGHRPLKQAAWNFARGNNLLVYWVR